VKPQPAKENARPSEPRSQSASPTGSVEWNCDWVPALAEPYLRGYAVRTEAGESLLGYRFLAQPAAAPQSTQRSRGAREALFAGFFIGYLLDPRDFAFLKPTTPEFLVFCFLEPVGGRSHRRLVGEPDSLMRRTAEYIRWLTHHPPRFELYADEHAALVRHIPIQEWPAGRTEHYARNFTIETLAWLVRSALIRRLPEEITSSPHSATKSLAARK
jgi:hypothetical protein